MYMPMWRWYMAASVVDLSNGGTVAPNERLALLVSQVEVDVPAHEAQLLVAEWELYFSGFLNDPVYRPLVLAHGGNRSPEEKLAIMTSWLQERKNYNSYFVRYVFGKLIERRLGVEQHRAFWEAVLANKLP